MSENGWRKTVKFRRSDWLLIVAAAAHQNKTVEEYILDTLTKTAREVLRNDSPQP